jgi:lipopolysaccharide transport system permease protein
MQDRSSTNSQWWKWEINSKQRLFSLGLREIYYNRGLVLRLVRRDLLASYYQTLIGPFWIFLQPLLTTLVYIIIFDKFAKIRTDTKIPPILFYLPGSIIWTFFSDCLTGTMYTFIANAHIFSKVYFPRLVVPISNTITQSIRLLIQCFLFIIIYLYYYFRYHNVDPSSSTVLFLVPLLVLLTAAFAMGSGLIASVFVAKYRDLETFIQFFLRLFMFATPVVYPSDIVPEEYKVIFWLNPLTPIIETFRSAFLSNGDATKEYLLIATAEVFVIFIVGLFLFKRREVKVMDTI